MSKRQKEVTIYERGGGRLYGDFRPYGGKLEALIEKGEQRATTDYARAQMLVGERLRELEIARRQVIVSTGRSQETTLGAFAEYHLKQKRDNNEATDWTLGGVQRSLERAVEFFGASKPLTAIHPYC